ncbi:MAG: aldehyde dehydrogenase [Bacteroidales bacterium]|nr:aldehyde dehydrogenase [Bacteroidales bacterium]
MKKIVDSQKAFFRSNQTRDVHFRINQLKKLKNILKENEQDLYKSIYSDFKKSSYETYVSELAHVYHEINMACKKVKKWSRIKKAKTNIMNLPAKSYVVPQPLGVVLVISSWNFPYMLSLVPVVSALAAGNTAVLKPSELPESSSHILAQLINKNFNPEYLKVVEGGIPETTELINQKFDKIFFTGSIAVGKIVYEAAAKNMVPVTLELGGKNPAIFTENCNLKTGVKRLIWAKFLNAGQTCVAPDYVLVHKSVKKEFLKLAISEIEKSRFSYENSNYVQIINDQHIKRLIRLMDQMQIHYGGGYDLESRHIDPTILTEVTFEDHIMQEEIFGPILPVIEYENIDAAIAQIKSKPSPLACYLFTNDSTIKNKFRHEISFGGGAINEAVMQFINSNLPFGGIGPSGMGSYHGEYGFKNFTHYKSILDRPTWFESNIKYFPHTKAKLILIKKLVE